MTDVLSLEAQEVQGLAVHVLFNTEKGVKFHLLQEVQGLAVLFNTEEE